MSVYIDRKYLGMIQFKLERFRQKSTDLYNFRCPLCGDSKKSRIRARGFIYRKGNDYFYRCHNCGAGTTFGLFLKHIEPNAYNEYVLERYADGDNKHSNIEKPNLDKFKGSEIAKQFEAHRISNINDLSEFSINNLPDGHYAKEYIHEIRAIPVEFWNEIFYTDNYRKFVEDNFPEIDLSGKQIPEDDRIVLAFTDQTGNITGISGRALSDTKLRYMTLKIKEERKFFGLHRLDTSKTIYVVEGQFDSFFLDNCVASGDSSLDSIGNIFDPILVYDNEPRNKEIVKNVERSIDKGFRVCIFPDYIKEKDLNDMTLLGGYDVKKVVTENVFQGAQAMMKFIGWKRV